MKKLSTVVGIAATLTLLSGGAAVAQPDHQERKSVRPTLSVPAKQVQGKPFTITIKRHGIKGTYRVQRRVAGQPAWMTVARGTKRARVITIKRTEKYSRSVAFRTVIGKRVSKVDRIAITRAPRVTPPPPPVPPKPVTSLHLGAGKQSGDDIMVGDTYQVYGAFTKDDEGLAGAPVKIERKDPGAAVWTLVGTYTTDLDGEFAFDTNSSKHGMTSFRGSTGAYTSSTQVPVFEVLKMPTSGPGVTVTGQGCARTASGQGDLSFSIKGVAAVPGVPPAPPVPACVTKPGDFVQVAWKFPAGATCLPVGLENFVFSGSSDATALQVRTTVVIDGQELANRLLARGGSLGKVRVGGDPMESLTLRMQVTDGTGDFLGEVTGAETTCL